MSAWNTKDMASALPDPGEDGQPAAVTAAHKTPQEHGWTEKTAYDYDKYNQSTQVAAPVHERDGREADQETPEEEALAEAVGGLAPNDWASNAAKYEWDDSFGDVGPRFPELEKQLFGTENHVKSGIEFSKYYFILTNMQ